MGVGGISSALLTVIKARRTFVHIMTLGYAEKKATVLLSALSVNTAYSVAYVVVRGRDRTSSPGPTCVEVILYVVYCVSKKLKYFCANPVSI